MIEIEKFKIILEDKGIDISKYGKGKAKTIEHLFKEIENKETILIDEKGKFLRKVQVVNIEIFYTNKNGEKFILKEDRQVFDDGRERKRTHLSGSLSGKMKVDENPKESIIREIQEELGIDSIIDVVEKSKDVEMVESPSYPGLPTEYVTYRFEANIPNKDFKLEGYTEKDNGLTNFFVWQKINN